MKTKYQFFLLLAVVFPLIWSSCNNDDDENNITPPEVNVPELTLEKGSTEVKTGNDATISITDGGGEYRAFSLNEDIAAVEVSGNNLVINGLAIGKTSVIISDKNNLYYNLPVLVYTFDEITVDQQEINIKARLGYSQSSVVKITQGNGSYTVSSDNENVEVSLSGDEVTINSNGQEGTANVTITDLRGLTAVIPVEVVTTTVPYEEDELTTIKEDETLRYVFNGLTTTNEGSWFNFLNSTDGNTNLYGWDYYGYYYLKIYFSGDKEVGKKSDGKLSTQYYSSGYTPFTDEPVDFEIIKNDGTRIWAVYSFVKDEKLYYGHFCQNINP